MSFTNQLLKWFDSYGRHDLPWQQEPSPYKVWLSEIMLQQTQVATVIPYFQKFLSAFPDVATLAAAPIDKVLAMWAGLGYYARARNLHKTAQYIMTKHQGVFPTDLEAWLALPGIGRSTAGAILAFTTEQRYPILDGNVKRVLSRYFAVKGVSATRVVQDALWALSDRCTPKKRVHHYTQAIMDLGATLCTRRKPKCSLCPVATNCQALRENKVHLYPERAIKTEKPIRCTQMLLLLDTHSNKVLLEKRPSKGIWGGLWSLPEYNWDGPVRQWYSTQPDNSLAIHKTQKWKPFRHTFTHYHLDIQPCLVKVTQKNRQKPFKLFDRISQWQSIEKALKIGLPTPVKRLLSTLTEI